MAIAKNPRRNWSGRPEDPTVWERLRDEMESLEQEEAERDMRQEGRPLEVPLGTEEPPPTRRLLDGTEEPDISRMLRRPELDDELDDLAPGTSDPAPGSEEEGPYPEDEDRLYARGYAEGGLIEDVPLRESYPSERVYFKANPHVTGMATEDHHVILNPYVDLDDDQRGAVILNEQARVFMRRNRLAPEFDVTPEQAQAFLGYGSPADIRATIAARILSGDQSSRATEQQRRWVEEHLAPRRRYAEGGLVGGGWLDQATGGEKPLRPEETPEGVGLKRPGEKRRLLTDEEHLQILKAQVDDPHRVRSPGSDAELNREIEKVQRRIERGGAIAAPERPMAAGAIARPDRPPPSGGWLDTATQAASAPGAASNMDARDLMAQRATEEGDPFRGQSNMPGDEAEGDRLPRAPWTGEGGVFTNAPAVMVAALKNTAAGVQRMVADESATQRREALGAIEPRQGIDVPGGAGPHAEPAGALRRQAGQAEQRHREALKTAETAGKEAKLWAAQTKREMELVTPEHMDTTQQAVWSLVQSAPPTLIGISLGIVTRNPWLAMSIAGGGGSAMQTGSTYNEALDKGANQRMAGMAASIDGILEGVGEALPLGVALKRGSPFFARLFNTMAVEAGQEAATQVMQDLNAYLVYNPNITLQEAWQNLKVATLAGAFGGAVYGTIGHAIDPKAEERPVLTEGQIRSIREQVAAIMDADSTMGPLKDAARAKVAASAATMSHRLEDGTPVKPYREGGKEQPGLWVDANGTVFESERAEPTQQEPNAKWRVGGVDYDVQVTGKGKAGMARLADGQEVPVNALQLDDEAKKVLGIAEPEEKGAIAIKKPKKTAVSVKKEDLVAAAEAAPAKEGQPAAPVVKPAIAPRGAGLEEGAAGAPAPAAPAAPKLEDEPQAERYQWMRNKEGGQTYGNVQEIRPLTKPLFERYMQPKVRAELKDYDTYRKEVPEVTHISLIKRAAREQVGKDDRAEAADADWRFERAGTPGELRPGPEATTKGWARKVEDFESKEAKRQGQTADSEAAVVKLEGTRSLQRQNRLREGVASVAQMNQIANAPDYDRLSFSKSPESGAPMVSIAGDTPLAPEALGKKSLVTIGGVKVPVQYAVIESTKLLASHTAEGRQRPEYFADPQPGEIRALNNGRAAGLREAYMRDTAAGYRKAMAADDEHGIPPEVIGKMERPVLVRVYPDEFNTKIENIGEASQGETLEQSPLEIALQDAAKLDSLEGFQPSENGDVSAASNDDFVRRFISTIVPEPQRGRLYGQDKKPNKLAYDRIEAAIFQKAYGSKDLTGMFAEANDPEIRAVLNALAIAAPDMAKIEGAPELVDIRPFVAEAAKTILQAKRAGAKLEQYLKQQDIMGRNPLVQELAEFMSANIRSPRKMGEGFKAAAQFVQFAVQDAATGDIFGDKPALSVSDALGALNRFMEKEYGPAQITPQQGKVAQDSPRYAAGVQAPARPDAARERSQSGAPAARAAGPAAAPQARPVRREEGPVDRYGNRIRGHWAGPRITGEVMWSEPNPGTHIGEVSGKAVAAITEEEGDIVLSVEGWLFSLGPKAKSARPFPTVFRAKDTAEIILGNDPSPSRIPRWIGQQITGQVSWEQEKRGAGWVGSIGGQAVATVQVIAKPREDIFVYELTIPGYQFANGTSSQRYTNRSQLARAEAERIFGGPMARAPKGGYDTSKGRKAVEDLLKARAGMFKDLRWRIELPGEDGILDVTRPSVVIESIEVKIKRNSHSRELLKDINALGYDVIPEEIDGDEAWAFWNQMADEGLANGDYFVDYEGEEETPPKGAIQPPKPQKPFSKKELIAQMQEKARREQENAELEAEWAAERVELKKNIEAARGKLDQVPEPLRKTFASVLDILQKQSVEDSRGTARSKIYEQYKHEEAAHYQKIFDRIKAIGGENVYVDEGNPQRHTAEIATPAGMLEIWKSRSGIKGKKDKKDPYGAGGYNFDLDRTTLPKRMRFDKYVNITIQEAAALHKLYSADRVMEGKTGVKVGQFQGKLVTTMGGGGHGYIEEVYEVVPKEEYKGKTHTYGQAGRRGDASDEDQDFYHGMVVKGPKKRDYVLRYLVTVVNEEDVYAYEREQDEKERKARKARGEREYEDEDEEEGGEVAAPQEDMFGEVGRVERDAARGDEAIVVTVFTSGLSRPSDFKEALQENTHVGVEIGEVSDASIPKLAAALAESDATLFVDSGAYSVFMANERAKGGPQFTMEEFGSGGKAIDFDEVFDRYHKLQLETSRADEENGGEAATRILFVMPDIVGDQAGSIALAQRYAEYIGDYGMQAIVPLQAGKLTLLEAYDEIKAVVGWKTFRVGIPANKLAAPDEQVEELLRARGKDIEGVHFLGAGSRSRIKPKLDSIRNTGYDGILTSDANALRSKLTEGTSRSEAFAAAIADRVTVTPMGPAPAALPSEKAQIAQEWQARRAKDFADTGDYEIDIGGKTRLFFRDPESKWWYEEGPGHFAERVLGFTKAEAIARLKQKYGEKAWTSRATTSPKGEATGATLHEKGDQLIREVPDQSGPMFFAFRKKPGAGYQEIGDARTLEGAKALFDKGGVLTSYTEEELRKKEQQAQTGQVEAVAPLTGDQPPLLTPPPGTAPPPDVTTIEPAAPTGDMFGTDFAQLKKPSGGRTGGSPGQGSLFQPSGEYNIKAVEQQLDLLGHEDLWTARLNRLLSIYGKEGVKKIRDGVAGMSEDKREAAVRALIRLELAAYALQGDGFVLKALKPDVEARNSAADGVLDVDRLKAFFEPEDPVFDLRSKVMTMLLVQVIKRHPVFSAAVAENEYAQSFASSEDDTYSGIWGKIIRDRVNPIVRTVFEGATVFAPVNEALSYLFGMSGESTRKSAWGDLKRIEAIGALDELHPSRLTYMPTVDNAIRQRQTTRNELKVLLGKDGVRLVNIAKRATKDDFLFGGITKAAVDRRTLEQFDKGQMPYYNPYHGLVNAPSRSEQLAAYVPKGQGDVFSDFNKIFAEDADLIINAARMSPSQFYDAIQRGAVEHLKTVVKPNAARRRKARRTFMIEDRELKPVTFEQERAQLAEAQADWEKIRQDPRSGKTSLFSPAGEYAVAGIEVKVEVTVPETGDKETVEMEAGEALKEIDDNLLLARRLDECLRS